MGSIMKYLFMAVAGFLVIAPVIHAKQGGDQYPNGVEGFMAGALPPSGTYFLNYAGYKGGDLQDSSGDELPVQLGAWFNALRIVHVTEKKLFGADYAVAGILPLVRLEFDTPGGNESTNGFGDITLTPIILGWHRTNWHWAAALDINLPTGTYDHDNSLKQIGSHYTSFEPLFAVTYLNESGWEASGKFMYNIKTKNDDTDVQSGAEFHVDYTFAKHVGPWALGFGGYYLKQVENDELAGVEISDSEGQVVAVGPQVKYDSSYGSFILKWHHEFEAENRFEGDSVLFKYIMRF